MPVFLQEILRFIAAIIPFIAMLLLSFWVNLSKPKRSRQFIMPLIALIYCVIAVIFADRINQRINYYIELIGMHFPAALNLNFTGWLNFIFNAVIAAGFLAVKGILLPIASIVWSKARFLFHQTSGLFYEYNDRMNAWVLKDEYGQAKSLWKGYYWFSVVISSVILTLSKIFPYWIVFQTPFYPVFCILVMGEILFFLSGLTFQEMLSTIAGDNEEYYRVSNYGTLLRIFHDLFENRILTDRTADNLYGLSSFEMLDNLAESENSTEVIVSKYFTELKEKGYDIDPGFVRSSINMINGKSVLLNTPFYHDLTGYIALPLVRRLLSYEKALIIVGRDSAVSDVRDWIHDGIASSCGTPELWKTTVLTDKRTETDVGVLRFADIYNRNVLDKNADFLSHVGFVLLIEPSRIISTGQIGLSLIVDQIGKIEKNVVFCSCDRNCDGLVDTLSHIFKVSMTEVFATIPTTAICSLMHWNAHGDFMHHKLLPNIAHYLGVGTELSSVALKYQIANTFWISSERFPVLDMRWIIGQYYNYLCSYIGCPQSQEALSDLFKVDANLWNLEIKNNIYLSIEDEFYNLFEMSRLYSTRARNQGFINVISENYLLRDYMVSNAMLFAADSKVIPSIVPDYTRTERNTVVSLIIRMFGGEVSDTELNHRLSIAGIKFDNAYRTFCELIPKHCNVDNADITIIYKEELDDEEMRFEQILYYTIPDNDSIFSNYARTLSNAYLIIEDDKDKNYYLGAILYGQVFQKYLPGQYLTYSGKYYQVQTITPQSGIVLRRAADHINDRKSYRQRRTYFLSDFSLDQTMGSCRTFRGIEIKRGFCRILARTHGYYELTSLDNLAGAHQVDVNNIPERTYKNKAILYLKLPGVSEEVRFTITLLLNEIFISIYPESYHYITAVIKRLSDTDSNIIKLLNLLQLNGFDDEDAIYIIEDCEIDLGLLGSVERNVTRLIEIIADYLSWYDKKINEKFDRQEGDGSDKITETTEDEEQTEDIAEENIEINEEDDDEEVISENEDSHEDEAITEDVDLEEQKIPDEAESAAEEKKAITDEETDNIDEVLIVDDDQEAETTEEDPQELEEKDEDSFMEEQETVTEAAAVEEQEFQDEDIPVSDEYKPAFPKKYSDTDYLQFGYDQTDPMLNIKDTLNFLKQHGYDKNALEQARTNSDLAARMDEDIDFKKPDTHFCDFCAVELSSCEYDILSDGRERCMQCTNSALKTVEQFTRIYEKALRNMETFFGIRINVPIKVCMTDAKKIARLCGEKFIPTPGYDARILAFAKKASDGYTIYVENGSPKIAAAANIVHELTHIWQYINWNKKQIRSHYGKNNELLIYEGMAKWAEIQYLLFINEVSYAKRQEIYTRMRDDPYGIGFIKYADQYQLVYGPGFRKSSPFKHGLPLELPL